MAESFSEKREAISEPDYQRYKSAPVLLYRQLSQQHTEEQFHSLPWISNNAIAAEINKIYEEANQLTSLRAFVAIYSGILLWIGCWNLLHLELLKLINKYIWHRSLEIGASIYGVLGILMMFHVGTLYNNAGFGGTWRRSEYYSTHLKIKLIFAYFGQFLYYISLFAFFDAIYAKQLHIKGTSDTMSMFIVDVVLWTFGYLILFTTNTFWVIAGVSPPFYEAKSIEIHDSVSKHVQFSVMSCIVIFAYSVIWSTSSRFLENYGEGSIWRELFYTAAGLLLFIATGNFVANSAIWMDPEDQHELNMSSVDAATNEFASSELIVNDQKSVGLFNIEDFDDYEKYEDALLKKLDPAQKLLAAQSREEQKREEILLMSPSRKGTKCLTYLVYYIRGFISLESQILHTTGSWTFFDTYFIEWSYWRDIGYVVVGLLGLWWSKAVFLKACITPFNVAGAHPDGLIKAIKRQHDFERRKTL